MFVKFAYLPRSHGTIMPIAYDPSKPFATIREFAASLGWHGLQMWQMDLDDGTVVTWDKTSDRKFFLQINEHPIGNADVHAAVVWAHRYGICTGYHTFDTNDRDAADRLKPWLLRRQFRDRLWRRQFKSRHPECSEQSRRWPPYFPDEPKPAVI